MIRRSFILGASALAVATSTNGARADGPATRRFRILRDGSDIGRHDLTARRTGQGFEIDIDIDIRVRVLGFTAYRYTLTNREIWSGGRLIRLDSEANDDGTKVSLAVRGGSGRLEIDGSELNGTAPADAVTTSYFANEFLDRRPWISTQSGKLLDVSVERSGRESGGRAWQVVGDLETRLVYDDRGEWVNSIFDAGGETARYEIVDQSGEIGSLWRGA